MKVFSILFLFFSLSFGSANAQPVQYEEEVYANMPAEQIYDSGNFRYIGQQPQQVYADDVYMLPQVIPAARNGSIKAIRQRDRIRCGSNMQVKTYAHYEDGVWTGIDADFCRVFALALLGDNSKIEMVDVRPNEIANALNSGKIDVMLSGVSYSAATETSRQALSAGLLYYDHQILLVSKKLGETNDDLRGKKICISTDTDYYKNFDDYNMRYGLDIKYLTFANLPKAREAFLLKRCDMMTANGLTLYGILKDLPKAKAKIVKTYISLYPIYAFVRKDNHELQLAVKWILNALFLAEQYGISVRNLAYFATNDNPEVRNLMGDNPKLWQNLGVRPQWMRDAIKMIGNYADIYDKNLGQNSPYKLERREGRLVKDGGTIYPIPFM